MSPRPLLDEPTIVVFRALPGLGDWLCVVPTLRELRAARPGARIHLVGLPATLPFVRRFRGLVDAFHAFPGWPGLPDRPLDATAVPGFLAAIQALEADLAIQLHGSGEIANDLVELFGAGAVAGFTRPDARRPETGCFLEWDDGEPEVRRGLRLLAALGLPASDDRLEFPLDPAARGRATALLGTQAGAVVARHVVVHPGGRRARDRWPTEGFVALGRELAGRGHRVLVTGDATEGELTGAVAAAIPGAVDLGGRTDLDLLAWLVHDALLVVANDTGVAHLADALAARTVVVFGNDDGTRASRWAPLDESLHAVGSGTVDEVMGVLRLALADAERAAIAAPRSAA